MTDIRDIYLPDIPVEHTTTIARPLQVVMQPLPKVIQRSNVTPTLSTLPVPSTSFTEAVTHVPLFSKTVLYVGLVVVATAVVAIGLKMWRDQQAALKTKDQECDFTLLEKGHQF